MGSFCCLRAFLSLCGPFISFQGRLNSPKGHPPCWARDFVLSGPLLCLFLCTRQAFPCLQALLPLSLPTHLAILFHPFLLQHQWPPPTRGPSPATLQHPLWLWCLGVLPASTQACLSPVRMSALQGRLWAAGFPPGLLFLAGVTIYILTVGI